MANSAFELTSSQSGFVLLDTQTASTSATLDFTSSIDGTYDHYEFHLINLRPATDGVRLYLRTSTDGGSTYDSGASNYTFILTGYVNGSVSNNNSASLGTTFVALNSPTIGNAATESISGVVRMYQPSEATYTQMNWGVGGHSTAVDANFWQNGQGRRQSSADVDAVRFLMSAGNITSGIVKLYGVN